MSTDGRDLAVLPADISTLKILRAAVKRMTLSRKRYACRGRPSTSHPAHRSDEHNRFPTPRPDAVVKPVQGCIFRLAARQKGPEAVQCGEREVARPGADAATAVALYEVNVPTVAVVVEIEENAGQLKFLYL